MKQNRRLLFCFFALLAWTHAQAQEKNTLVFQGGTGPGTMVKQGVWTQWFTKISNPSREEKIARVGCLSDQPDGGKIVFSRVVTLPGFCQRIVSLAFQPGVPVPSPGRGAEQTYVVWDDQTGQQVQSRTGYVTYAPGKALLYGLLQANHIEHDETSYVKADSLRRLLGIAGFGALRRTNLPDVWYGYSSLKYLALGGVDSEMFRSSQIEAILQWVRNGGCLLLLGGQELPEFLNGPIGQAAGVRGIGVHVTDSLNVSNVSQPSEKQAVLSLVWPMPMVELYTPEAEVLYAANGLPLLTVRRVGKGCIFTSAVPSGVLKPRNGYNVWSDISRIASVRGVVDDEAFLTPGRGVLQQIAGRKGPDRYVPVSILAGFLSVVVGLGVLLRFVRRGEWLWILLVPLGLVVGIGLFYYSRQRVDPQRLSHVGLITGLGNDQAQVQQALAYFSGPEPRRLSLPSGAPAGLVQDLGASAAAGMKIEEIRTTAQGTELPDQTVNPNATRAFYTRTIQPFSALRGALGFDETGLIGEVTNTLPADIENAVLMVNFHTYRLGTLPAGQTKTVRVGDDDLLGRVQFPLPKRTAGNMPAVSSERNARASKKQSSGAKEPSPPPADPRVEGEFSSAIVPDKRQTMLVRRLIPPPDFHTEFADGTRLIGYTTTTGVDLFSGRDLQRQGWSILYWPMTFDTPQTGQIVRIPGGWVNLTYHRVSNWDYRHQRFIETTRDGKINFSAAPPAGIRLQNITARVDIDIRAIDYRMELFGILPAPPGGRKEPVLLGTVDRPNGLATLSVPDADRFLDEMGRIRMKLEVKRATLELPDLTRGNPSAKKLSHGAAGAPWNLQRIDVSLKGTVR